MKKIFNFLFGKKQPTNDNIFNRRVTFKTVVPPERPSFEQWCSELNVSCWHGRQTIHLG